MSLNARVLPDCAAYPAAAEPLVGTARGHAPHLLKVSVWVTFYPSWPLVTFFRNIAGGQTKFDWSLFSDEERKNVKIMLFCANLCFLHHRIHKRTPFHDRRTQCFAYGTFFLL